MALSERQRHCLRGMGITPWVSRDHLPTAESTVVDDAVEPVAERPGLQTIQDYTRSPKVASKPTDTAPDVTIATDLQTLDLNGWESIEASIEACKNCELAASCTRKVPGKGNRNAELMIIGEAPGHDEDLQGKPFVGRAGQLLDRMLEAISIDPADVYVTNILKCRPPQNRDPRPEEVQACSAFLSAQIMAVKPSVILSVGRISAQNLLQEQTPVGKLRGITHDLPDHSIPLRVTYHPAYLLRNPAEKAKVWQDLKALYQMLNHAED